MDTEDRWPRLVGGHVALDFVNTDVFSQEDRDDDVLRSAEEYVAWCEYAGVTSAVSASSDLSAAQERTFLKDAAALRGAVRSIVEAIVGHESPDREAMVALRAAWADAVRRAEPALGDGRLSWKWETATPRAALCEIIDAAVELLRYGATDRLKSCPSCAFVFIDSTKNGRRRWCSMDDCGTQEKMRRYVAKRAQGSRTAATSG